MQGVFAMARPGDAALRNGYTVVWAPAHTTLSEMQAQLEPDSQGITRTARGLGWRVPISSEMEFRAKVGAAPRR